MAKAAARRTTLSQPKWLFGYLLKASGISHCYAWVGAQETELKYCSLIKVFNEWNVSIVVHIS